MDQTITLRNLGPDDLDCLLAPGVDVFDFPVREDQARAFLADPLHEIVLAYDGARVVGFASGVMMFHPDKPPAFFVNEVGVNESHQRRGIATSLMLRIIAIARGRGCEGIWLGTEADNLPAIGLYRSLKAQEVQGIYFGWDDAL